MGTAAATATPDRPGRPGPFTADQVELARDYVRHMRGHINDAHKHKDCGYIRAFRKITGKEPTPLAIAKFCAEVDRELESLAGPGDGGVPRRREGALEEVVARLERRAKLGLPKPGPVTFAAEPGRTQMFDSGREARRARTHAWMNGEPTPPPPMSPEREARRVATQQWAAAQEPPAAGARAIAPTPAPVAFNPPGCSPLLHLEEPDFLEAAREVLGGAEGLEAAARSSAAQVEAMLPGAGPHLSGMAVHAAVLARVGRGLPVDPDGVEVEAGALLLGRRRGLTVSGLEAAAARFLADGAAAERRLTQQITSHAADLARDRRVHEFSEMAGLRVLERVELRRKVKQVEASLEALRPAVADLARAALEAAGGAERVGLLIREAMMAGGSWPGVDHQLRDLQARLKAAAEKMDRFRPVDPETPEGPLAVAARADRDALVPLVEARRLEVERAATRRVDDLVADAMAGDSHALDEVAAHVARTPGGFPAEFGPSLARIAPAAALEAGPSGFLWCV